MLPHRIARSPGALLLGVVAACGGEPAPASGTAEPAGGALRVEPAAQRREFERVVLVTLDTLRTDHVSCYGYPRPTTPFLDSLAARGARFTRAMAAISHTAPSHATMLTGLVPAVHGVLQNGGQLAADSSDLAALFAREGYETAAFLNVKFLNGVARSFRRVGVRSFQDGRVQTGADVVDGALEWLRTKRKGPRFFLWVHLYDPHRWKELVLEREGDPAPLWGGPTPPDFLATVAALHGLPAPVEGQPYRVDWQVEDEKRSVTHIDFGSASSFLRCIDAYDSMVSFSDRALERLVRGLEELALPGRTLWVVTSDHGEGLASHGVAGHGGRIYQEQLHVPLIVHASDGSLPARVIDELVGHVDLFPTLVEVLGLAARGGLPLYEGRSLWPLLEGQAEENGERWPARAVFAQRRPAEDEGEEEGEAERELLYALQDEHHKLILQAPGSAELFDLAADPREARSLGVDHPDAARLRATLEERLRAFASVRVHSDEAVPEEWLQELRDLGYVR